LHSVFESAPGMCTLIHQTGQVQSSVHNERQLCLKMFRVVNISINFNPNVPCRAWCPLRSIVHQQCGKHADVSNERRERDSEREGGREREIWGHGDPRTSRWAVVEATALISKRDFRTVYQKRFTSVCARGSGRPSVYRHPRAASSGRWA